MAGDWSELSPDFEWDGTWRDIYVLNTARTDWERVLDVLQTWSPPPSITLRGVAVPMPTPDALFDGQHKGYQLEVSAGGVRLNCHFFRADQIEFDMDPKEVVGPRELAGLVGFMRTLAASTGKPVLLTPENMPECPILSCLSNGEVSIQGLNDGLP